MQTHHQLPVLLRMSAALLLCTFVSGTLAAQVQTTSSATRHVRSEVTSGKARLLRPLPSSQSMRLDLMLPLRNREQLDLLVRDLYDSQSPFFHQFLTVQQFTERFSPTADDYAQVVQFAKDIGLTVLGSAPNRMVVSVQGPVATVEKAFHVSMGSYQHPTEQRTFYSPDREPTLNLNVKLWHISGLDNFSVPQPMSLVRSLDIQSNATGSGPNGNFIGSDFRTAYYGGNLDGSGQSIALVEFAGYNINDVTNYFSQVGQPFNPNVVVGISTDGSSLDCSGSCDDTEQVLDVEAALSMAPAVNSILVYVSDTSDVSIFNQMAVDNIAKSISCSWGWSPADPASDDPIFLEFAAQGQTIFVASGDSGGYRTRSPSVFPADDIWVTSVGGTDLITSGPNGDWVNETAWISGGGGISPNRISVPFYQVVTASQTPLASTLYRNAPDVSAEANTDNFICYRGTCSGGWGGTSFAAPRWAGLMALVNQQSVAQWNAPVGFINAAIYGIALGPNYYDNFHDITSGNNGRYLATPGYDLVTGWGSPKGATLIDFLSFR